MTPRRPNLLIGVSLFVSLAIFLISALVLVEMRQDALRRAQEAATNLSLIVERDTSRNLEIYDLSLQAVIDGLQEPGVNKLPPLMRQKVLFDRSASAKDLGALLVVDERGNIVIDSRSVPARRVNVADRDYFKVHLKSPGVGLYVSHPFVPRLGEGGDTIALSRRLSHSDGTFAGIVVGTLRLNYFRRLFDGMNLGSGGSMALMLDDGTMLMRRPYDQKVIGRSLMGTANYTRFAQTSNGAFFGTAALDGVKRWYTYRHISGFPIILDVALATDDIYAEWRGRAWTIGSLMAALDVMIIGFALLFSQQWKRRLAFEEELRVLARTDGLTGLHNRRTFEEMADIEWRRAQRTGQPLSMLLIDVDHFKGFNDLYGHSAGDDALIAVAYCISQSIRRPGDIAGRYGGEEFTVLLPNTDSGGAAHMAEKILASVRALELRHVASTHQFLSVSIGVACAVDQRFPTLRSLVNASDAAMYEAKNSGRNRVACYPVATQQDSALSAQSSEGCAN
jgi:diguanylate cyclase (GGDEF)-like protein